MGDILNRNNLLFPYLRRRVEGRALRAVGPATEEVPTSDGGSRAVVTLSGAVAQVVHPPRWPRDEVRVPREVIPVFFCCRFFFIFFLLLRFLLLF